MNTIDKNKLTEKVWHFTSLDALPAIMLGHDGILAGHTSFMDDPDDTSLTRQATTMILDILRGRLLNDKPDKAEREEIIPIVKSRILSGAIYPFFIACLSKRIDVFDMWKEYTGNGGFALEIRYPEFKDDVEDIENGIEFVDCSYDSFDEGVETVKKVGDAIRQYNEAVASKESPEFSDKDLMIITKKLRDLAKKLVGNKRSRFGFENEIRLVRNFETTISAKDIRFIGPKPFVAIHTKKPFVEYVDKILVSPFGDVKKSLALASMVSTALGKSADFVQEMKLTVASQL